MIQFPDVVAGGAGLGGEHFVAKIAATSTVEKMDQVILPPWEQK